MAYIAILVYLLMLFSATDTKKLFKESAIACLLLITSSLTFSSCTEFTLVNYPVTDLIIFRTVLILLPEFNICLL
jgi:hypothetical protein